MSHEVFHGRTAAAVLGWMALLALIVAAGPVSPAERAAAKQPGQITARLGISAGAAIEDAPLGLCGWELQHRIPILFETAAAMDIQIETLSVGQGFFSDDGAFSSEKDLDLVITGRRERINALAAILGRAFDQSVVFVWHFDPGGAQATATIPLPEGAETLTAATYAQLVTELADGGHLRYAGDSDLIFVANTGDEPEAAFFARMERVRALLDRAGVSTGQVRSAPAEFVALDRDSYDEHIAASPTPPARAGATGHLTPYHQEHDACTEAAAA
ncbi:MAG: hypothetical protein AB7R89_02085 [Dehalococcoidia bacterium]